MFTTGSKWFLGLGLVSLVLAAAYGWTSGGTGLGPITVGYYGGVGDHLGYSMLLTIAAAAIFLGLVTVGIRDADPSALAQLAGTESAPTQPAPAHLAYWPVIGAFGLSAVVLGLVISNVLFIAGLILLIGVLVEWMVLAWSDRATGDPATNRLVRNRLMGPYEVPLAGVLIAGGTVAALSRLFLTASELGSVVAATIAGTVVIVIGALLATRPKLSPNLVAGVLVVAALGVVTTGVVSAARGERKIEHEGHTAEPETTGTTAPEESSTGLHANIPAGTERATTTTTEAAG
jgi:hypothetical protein